MKIGITGSLSSGKSAALKMLARNKYPSFSADHFGVSSGAVTIKTDGIDDTHIDFGTGTNQVSTADIPEQTNLYYTNARVQAISIDSAATKSFFSIKHLESHIDAS